MLHYFTCTSGNQAQGDSHSSKVTLYVNGIDGIYTQNSMNPNSMDLSVLAFCVLAVTLDKLLHLSELLFLQYKAQVKS